LMRELSAGGTSRAWLLSKHSTSKRLDQGAP
jgi:hypothetical protein